MPLITRHHLRLLIHHHHHHHHHPPSPHLLFSPFLPKFTTHKVKPNAFSLFTTFPFVTCNGNPKVKHKNTRGTHTDTFFNTDTVMDPTSTGGFNKRRAEGRDKVDKPKNLKLKVRKVNPVNTISYLQILGTGMDTQDTSPSVLLFFDKQRFIFNAGEGLQRYCTEHKIKLSKVDHIFLSRVCSETAGGLPGLLLTMAGIGDDGMCVNMWGPSDLKYMISAMRTFIPKAAMVHARSFGPSTDSDQISVPDFTKFSEPIELVKDEVVRISAIILQPNNNNEAKMLGSSEAGPGEGKDDRPVSNGANNVTQAVIKAGDLSVIYICELPEIQGKFDPEKAKALGLKPGPKYRDLQLGKSVKSDRLDIMVNPCDVMDPPITGPIVLLVDCPTTSHLQNLLSIGSLNIYFTDSSSNQTGISKEVNCIVHLTPSAVANNPGYQKWMERFGNAQHIMAGHERKNIQVPVLKSSARIAARLNYLCPQFFPAPGFWSLHNIADSVKISNSSLEVPKDIIAAENLLKFHLRPYANLGLDKSSIPSFAGPGEVMDELLLEIPDIADVAQQLRQLSYHPKEVNGFDVSSRHDACITEEPWFDEIGLPSCLENIGREDMEIVLLGTGSSQPSKYRNVSSIYINLFAKGGLLFDCGEGTLGQLKRRFGVEGADDAVRSLKFIWISHIHADHHTGLARILTLRRDLLKGVPHEPLLVIGPGQLMRFLNAYQRLEDLDMQFLDCKHTDKASWDEIDGFAHSISDQVSPASSGNNFDNTLFAKGSRMQSYMKKPSSPSSKEVSLQRLTYVKKELEDAGLATLVSFPVVHCPQAFGVALKAAQRISSTGEAMPGWKVVYSGDTRPCPELIEASHGATVLIHEATFEDGMVDEAIARNHSTTKEAIEVGEAAGVYRIILTHFSQRYPKIPVFDDSHMHNTCIGFDLMSINMADLPVLPQILKPLKLLFRNEMGVDETDELEAVKEA